MSVARRMTLRRKKASAVDQFEKEFALESLKSDRLRVVETSIPTAGMMIGSTFLGPIYTLFTPAAFRYPLFISLSALRLNVRLCIFTGNIR